MKVYFEGDYNGFAARKIYEASETLAGFPVGPDDLVIGDGNGGFNVAKRNLCKEYTGPIPAGFILLPEKQLGCRQPVEDGVKVEVFSNTGVTEIGHAECYNWLPDSDIIAYRIVEDKQMDLSKTDFDVQVDVPMTDEERLESQKEVLSELEDLGISVTEQMDVPSLTEGKIKVATQPRAEDPVLDAELLVLGPEKALEKIGLNNSGVSTYKEIPRPLVEMLFKSFELDVKDYLKEAQHGDGIELANHLRELGYAIDDSHVPFLTNYLQSIAD